VGQLYTRVFIQILDSSIAEDYTLRHVFEDFMKLVDWKTGQVDITREAMARRLNIPLEILNQKIKILESPDKASRDPDHDGRRLERLDEHRDWGWRILNWKKYEDMRNRADVSMRVARHRLRERQEENGSAHKLSNNVEVIKNQQALDRVEKKIKTLLGQAPFSKDSPLKTELAEMRSERSRLMKALDFKA
jgi:hypothetical protein